MCRVNAHVVVATSAADIVDQYAAIHVGDDIQKPDSDILVYSEEDDTSPILIFSCKTSCRERAGQTYKWKLLCDLATCEREHKGSSPACPATKYHLAYMPKRKVQMGFNTADLYEELKNPQISAMFSFFDHAYIAKIESPANNIVPLKKIVDDLNAVF